MANWGISRQVRYAQQPPVIHESVVGDLGAADEQKRDEQAHEGMTDGAVKGQIDDFSLLEDLYRVRPAEINETKGQNLGKGRSVHSKEHLNVVLSRAGDPVDPILFLVLLGVFFEFAFAGIEGSLALAGT